MEDLFSSGSLSLIANVLVLLFQAKLHTAVADLKVYMHQNFMPKRSAH